MFLCELGEMANDQVVKLYNDNQGSIALAKTSKFYKGTTHNDIHYHFVRKKVAEGQMILEYCWVKDMKSDLMTKSTIFI